MHLAVSGQRINVAITFAFIANAAVNINCIHFNVPYFTAVAGERIRCLNHLLSSSVHYRNALKTFLACRFVNFYQVKAIISSILLFSELIIH